MLFAEIDTGWIVVLTTAAGGALTAAGVLLEKYLKSKIDARAASAALEKTQRADTIAEWREITDRLQTELTAVLRRESDCREESAKLAGEVRLLQQSVRRIESDTGTVSPSRVPGLIVADLDGTIKSASPALAPVLHWLPQDLMGKSIDLLVPSRLLAQHRAALARVKETGQPPWPERTLLTYALTREGAEVAVTVRLYGWQAGNTWLVSAEISRRVPSGEGGVGVEATPYPPPRRQ